MRHGYLAGCALLVLVVAVAAHGGSAPLPSAAPPAESKAHWTNGEAYYNGHWVPLETLYKDYAAALAGFTRAKDNAYTVYKRLTQLQHQMTVLKNDRSAADRAVHIQLTQAQKKKQEYQKALDAPRPVRPSTKPLPSAPLRRDYASNYYYTLAMRDYYDQVTRINEVNRRAQEEYRRQLDEWQNTRDEAKKKLPQVETAITECEQKLQASAAEYETAAEPLQEQIASAKEEAEACKGEQTALETRVTALADALRTAPENVRHAHGIVKWEKRFWALAKLEAIYAKTQAEINQVRKSLKDAPPAWRHPQQDRMDALKALIDQAKADQKAAAAANATAR